MMMIVIPRIALLDAVLEAAHELKRQVVVQEVNAANDLVLNVRSGRVSCAIASGAKSGRKSLV